MSAQPEFNPQKGDEEYAKLPHYTEVRTREISGMVEPYIQVTDQYGQLIARLTLILGRIKPRDTQDIVIRDLMADVFDFLYEARAFILSGKFMMAFTLGRRAYESLSLLALCALDPSWADRWAQGKEISNGQVRKQLAKHKMGEPENLTKELYKYFCAVTHPNRGLILQRRLGEGNLFVLGAIAQPDLIMMTDIARYHLNMWYWLSAVVTYFYLLQIDQFDRSYGEAYLGTAKDAEHVGQELRENYNRLLEEFHAKQGQSAEA